MDNTDGSEIIGLSELVDLSIGTPEQGAVNFNLIRSVLQILIKQIRECTHETIFLKFKSPHSDMIRNLKENFNTSSKPFDFLVVKEKKNDTNTEYSDMQNAKISKESENERISSEIKGKVDENEIRPKILTLEVDDSLVLFTNQIKTLQEQYLTLTDAINDLTSQIKEIDGLIQKLIPNQIQIYPATFEPKFCKLFQSFRHESRYKCIKGVETELDDYNSIKLCSQKSTFGFSKGKNEWNKINDFKKKEPIYLETKKINIIFENQSIQFSDLSDNETNERVNELQEWNADKSLPRSQNTAHAKKIVGKSLHKKIHKCEEDTKEEITVGDPFTVPNKIDIGISSCLGSSKESGQKKLSNSCNIQLEEKKRKVEENFEKSSQVNEKEVQKLNRVNCNELNENSKVQFRYRYGVKLSTDEEAPDSKSCVYEEQSTKKHKNNIVCSTKDTEISENQDWSIDDPNNINTNPSNVPLKGDKSKLVENFENETQLIEKRVQKSNIVNCRELNKYSNAHQLKDSYGISLNKKGKYPDLKSSSLDKQSIKKQTISVSSTNNNKVTQNRDWYNDDPNNINTERFSILKLKEEKFKLEDHFDDKPQIDGKEVQKSDVEKHKELNKHTNAQFQDSNGFQLNIVEKCLDSNKSSFEKQFIGKQTNLTSKTNDIEFIHNRDWFTNDPDCINTNRSNNRIKEENYKLEDSFEKTLQLDQKGVQKANLLNEHTNARVQESCEVQLSTVEEYPDKKTSSFQKQFVKEKNSIVFGTNDTTFTQNQVYLNEDLKNSNSNGSSIQIKEGKGKLEDSFEKSLQLDEKIAVNEHLHVQSQECYGIKLNTVGKCPNSRNSSSEKQSIKEQNVSHRNDIKFTRNRDWFTNDPNCINTNTSNIQFKEKKSELKDNFVKRPQLDEYVGQQSNLVNCKELNKQSNSQFLNSYGVSPNIVVEYSDSRSSSFEKSFMEEQTNLISNTNDMKFIQNRDWLSKDLKSINANNQLNEKKCKLEDNFEKRLQLAQKDLSKPNVENYVELNKYSKAQMKDSFGVKLSNVEIYPDTKTSSFKKQSIKEQIKITSSPKDIKVTQHRDCFSDDPNYISTNQTSIQLKENKSKLEDSFEKNSHSDKKGVQKADVENYKELNIKHTDAQFQDSYGVSLNIVEKYSDSKSNPVEKQSIKEQTNLVSNTNDIKFTHHCLFGKNRNWFNDDPDYINCHMYDDKGLIKPMYDVASFKSAYDGLTYKKMDGKIQQSYNNKTTGQEHYQSAGVTTANFQEHTGSENKNMNDYKEINVVQEVNVSKSTCNDINNRLYSKFDIQKKTDTCCNKDQSKTFKKIEKSESLEKHHENNDLELAKGQPNSQLSSMNQSELNPLDIEIHSKSYLQAMPELNKKNSQFLVKTDKSNLLPKNLGKKTDINIERNTSCNTEHIKILKKIETLQLIEDNHQNNSFKWTKSKSDNKFQILNQTKSNFSDVQIHNKACQQVTPEVNNKNSKLLIKGDGSQIDQLQPLNCIHNEPDTKPTIIPKLKSLEMVFSKKSISTERIVLQMDCELIKNFSRRSRAENLRLYNNSKRESKNILKRKKRINQLNRVEKPNTMAKKSCPTIQKVEIAKNMRKNTIESMHVEVSSKKSIEPSRSFNDFRKESVEIRQVLHEKPTKFKSVENDKPLSPTKYHHANKLGARTLRFHNQPANSTDSSFNLMLSSNDALNAMNSSSDRMTHEDPGSLNGVNRLKELAEIVSEILNKKSYSEYSVFEDKTGDALKIVQEILQEMNVNPAIYSNNKSIDQLQILHEKIEQLESDLKYFTESKKVEENPFGNTNVDFTNNREVFSAIRDLQKQIQNLHSKIDQNTERIQSNTLCIDTLSEYVEEMDSRKVNMEELDMRLVTFVKRYNLEQNVNKEEFNQECEVLNEAMQTINIKLDIHKKYQELQSTIINKIFEILSNKSSRKEMKSMNDKLVQELHKTEEKLLRDCKIKEDDGASGTKKPVLRDLQCISCNRDVFMKEKIFPINQPIQTTVSNEHTNRRSKEKIINTNNSAGVRFCGGSHTKLSSTQKKKIMKKSPFKRYPLSLSELEKLYCPNLP